MFFQTGAAECQHGSVHTFICLPLMTAARDTLLGAAFIVWLTKESSVPFLLYSNAFLEKETRDIFKKCSVGFPSSLGCKHRVHLLRIKYMYSPWGATVSQLAWRAGGVMEMYLHNTWYHCTSIHYCDPAFVFLGNILLWKKHCLSSPPKILIDWDIYQYTGKMDKHVFPHEYWSKRIKSHASGHE